MKIHHDVLSSMTCISSILLAFSLACGGGDSKNPVDDGRSDTGGGDAIEFLSASEQKILDDAESSFKDMLKTSSRGAARQALVKQLSSTAGVKSATLFEDGSTVWITYADGSCALINTIDYAELSKGIDSIQYGTQKAARGNGMSVSESRMADTISQLTPGRKKILFLDIAEPSVPSTGNINRMKSMFLGYGWPESDITVKIRSSLTDKSITPRDMFNLGEYGIVIIYAHGVYGRVPGTTTTSYSHFIQICSNPSKSDPDAALYKQWNDQGLIAFSSEGIYIRNDLLMQKLQHMPGSIVYLCTCWGWYARNAFLSNGCGAFLGWTDIVMYVDAFPSAHTFFSLMCRSDPSTSVSSAFSNSSTTKSSANFEGRTAKLQNQANKSLLYLPAWAEVTVSSLPEGSERIRITAIKDGNTLADTTLAKTSGGTLENLAPGTVNFTAKAMKGDQALASIDNSTALHAGKNTLTFDFSHQIAKAQIYKRTFDTGYDWGPLGTVFYTYYIWDRNPKSNRYKIVGHYDDFVGNMDLTHPLPGEKYSIKNCLGPDEVTAIFGSNIFGVGANQVVYAREGSLWLNYKPNDQETLKEIEAKNVQMLDIVKNYWFEVYFN